MRYAVGDKYARRLALTFYLRLLGERDIGDDGPAVALIQGLAGLGKTALAAELIHLWYERFDYVLAFQAKPSPLQLDDLIRWLDQRLTLESPNCRERCRQYDLNHIHLGLNPSRNPRLFSEPGSRHQRMRANLLEALRDESVLLPPSGSHWVRCPSARPHSSCAATRTCAHWSSATTRPTRR